MSDMQLLRLAGILLINNALFGWFIFRDLRFWSREILNGTTRIVRHEVSQAVLKLTPLKPDFGQDSLLNEMALAKAKAHRFGVQSGFRNPDGSSQ